MSETSETVVETDWYKAGCTSGCRNGHTFRWRVCGHAKEPARRPGSMFRYTEFVADDGSTTWGFAPVPMSEYRLLDDPKPVLVVDSNDLTSAMRSGTPQHEQLLAWARSQGIDPNQASRIEVYGGDKPYAWVLMYDVDENGTKYGVPGTETYAKHAETVPLSSLPPLPETSR